MEPGPWSRGGRAGTCVGAKERARMRCVQSAWSARSGGELLPHHWSGRGRAMEDANIALTLILCVALGGTERSK
jgi:hypothetical protein